MILPAQSPISDIEGFNWVNLDGQWESREDLVNRLWHAGADVKLNTSRLDHHLAGPFKVS